MKRNTIVGCLKALCLFVALVMLNSCDDLESVIPDNTASVEEGKGGLYILCDGNYSLNNSTLALYSYSGKKLESDFFQVANGRKLGDTGNDLQRYGSKLYVVVNVSSQVEVLDAPTGKSIRQIPLFNGSAARQPRYVTFWENKAYVCSFDGTVTRIDTSSLQVEAVVQVGRNPDGIAAGNGKLYVSNSGGLDYANAAGYDNTVSVIDTHTFTETKRIRVGSNPGKIRADLFGRVYVACRGDYKAEKGVWQCIDTRTDQVTKTYDLNVTNFDFSGDLAYLYSYDNTSRESWIKVFNLESQMLVQDSFVADGTSIKTPYGINVNPENGDVFITDAGNYVSSGDVYCFDRKGFLKYKLPNVGISPNSVLYVADLAEKPEGPVDSAAVEARYLYRVLDYTPAPGQFVGTYPKFTTGESPEAMRIRVENALKGGAGGLVTLGRYGGSLTFAFKAAVTNVPGSNDFRIFGNAFVNSAEPGIVEVTVDANHNGLADDAWYELAGSAYAKSTTVKNYRICYYRPSVLADSVLFRDNRGISGRVNAYYPAWKGDSIVCTGTLLAPTAVQNDAGFWQLKSLEWGYADNQPNSSDLSCFDIEWAVDTNGQKVHLDSVDFIRVRTGVNQNAGWVGELSTEISGAEILRP